jgi:hypothetical protein
VEITPLPVAEAAKSPRRLMFTSEAAATLLKLLPLLLSAVVLGM